MSQFKDVKLAEGKRSVEYEAGWLNYYSIPVEHPLVLTANAIQKRQVLENFTEADAAVLNVAGINPHDPEFNLGDCRSKPLVSLLEVNGEIYWGTAGIRNPQRICERHISRIDDYDLCISHCAQPGHAEIIAAIKYLVSEGMDDATLKYISPEMTSNIAGYPLMGTVEHGRLLEVITSTGIKLPAGSNVYIHGVEYCCLKCAEILLELGATTILNCPPTHAGSYRRRDELHEKYKAES
jgi:hypothetical protein